MSEVLYDELKVCTAILALIAGMQSGTQFTSFTSTKVQILTPKLVYFFLPFSFSVCCLCALRIAKWFKSVEKAERDEEAFLAEAYASRSHTADF